MKIISIKVLEYYIINLTILECKYTNTGETLHLGEDNKSNHIGM